jgi:prepilin-type processing-associated H-X9-DG protein
MSFSFVGGQSWLDRAVPSPLGLAEQFEALGEAVARVPRRRRSWRRLAVGMLAVSGALVMSVVGPSALREARKTQCRENLSEIGRAFQKQIEAREHLPAAAITDKSGRSLLSWRVTILPYLGEQELFDEFHLDEPWDSPNNLALLPRMPKVYACPNEPGRYSFSSAYHIIVGPEEALGGARPLFDRAREVDLREVTDGTSNTFMVVETNQPVPWTKPEDLSFADGQPTPDFGSRHQGGFHAVFADGSVRFIRFTIESAILRGLVTRDGGEVTSGDS